MSSFHLHRRSVKKHNHHWKYCVRFNRDVPSSHIHWFIENTNSWVPFRCQLKYNHEENKYFRKKLSGDKWTSGGLVLASPNYPWNSIVYQQNYQSHLLIFIDNRTLSSLRINLHFYCLLFINKITKEVNPFWKYYQFFTVQFLSILRGNNSVSVCRSVTFETRSIWVLVHVKLDQINLI